MPGSKVTRVELETTKGKIVIAVNSEKAPKSVENFLAQVSSNFYDGTIFHRVIPGFMIQGGGFNPDMSQKPTSANVVNEADNGLSNTRGTVAMARKNTPHSASVQFFINVADNLALDHQSKTDGRTWGYAVFGEVLEGMDVVDAIVAVPTQTSGGHGNVPVDPVVVTKATILE